MDSSRPLVYLKIDGYDPVFKLVDGIEMFFLDLDTGEWVEDPFFMNIFFDTSMTYHEISEAEAQTEIDAVQSGRSR